MLALMCDEWLKRSDDHRVIIGLHEITLIHQLAEDLRKTLGIAVGIEQAENRINMASANHPRVIVFSRATLEEKEVAGESRSRLYKFPPMDYKWLLVADECHRWRWGMPSCRHIIEWFAKSEENKRFGLTATPKRSDGAKFTKLFPEVCLDYRFQDAVRDGWIVPFRQRWVHVKNVHVDASDVPSQIKMDKKFDEILRDKETLAGIVQPALKLCEGQTIAYTPDVKSAYAVAAEMNAQAGWDIAKALDGSVKKEERQYVFDQHKGGQFKFLVVCGLCREGYDDPNISDILCLRPIRKESSHLAEQMKGRGVRPHSSIAHKLGECETAVERRELIANSAKPVCNIIDMAGITGIPEVPSTVEILAEGLPDDVVLRAKRKAEKDGVDPLQAIEEAEREIKHEKEEQARREAERRKAIRARVEWVEREVRSGQGGSYQQTTANHRAKPRGTASEKQIAFLVKLGISKEKAETFSKQQAGAVITQRKGLKGADYRVTFGKHSGKALGELPPGYLNWIVQQNQDSGQFREVVEQIEIMDNQRSFDTEEIPF